MYQKVALITGITGQDGSYLAELLIQKDYIVHGIKRKSSYINSSRIDHIYESPQKSNKRLILHYGDMTDSTGILNLVKTIKPDEIYNLAAQSHVAVSFKTPDYSTSVNALGTLRVLEAIKILGFENCRFYQASTSELFGNSNQSPQNEETPFAPRSPYAISKLYSYWMTKHYREAYNIFASNGILFNHESPRRGETFVTKKIIKSMVRFSKDKSNITFLGNLDAKRDWGHAKDYMNAAWKIIQHDKPDDFCIGSGSQYSVREFVEKVAFTLKIKINWEGKGINEIAKDNNGNTVIAIDKKYFRPTEVDNLLADYSKAKKLLGWKPKYNLEELIDEMIDHEIKNYE
jgi:GDPmannose 4,6-dehydratase